MENFNKKIYFLNKIYYLLFKERFNKKISFDFPKNINRWDLIKRIIKEKKFNSYLEIGCDDDYSFSQIEVEKKIGVDPYSGGNYKGTSDEFFLKNSECFDCIFIDGLHEYDQVYKDIINSLKFLNEGGIILLHDCLPPSIHQQAVPRYKRTWNGDVWKAIVNIRTNANYDTVTCYIDHGVSIIRKQKNVDRLNLNINNFKNLKFKDFYYNYKKYMRLMDYKNIFDYLK
tara:strand:+ start:169 stop:852 length:684 start_codon:yes stop_codon:yes gene_type:complete